MTRETEITGDSPDQLHHDALHQEGLSAKERYDLLSEAIEKYSDEFNKARALRDRAKYAQALSYEDPETSDADAWKKDLEESFDKLENYSGARDKESVIREVAATDLIAGRLYLFDGLAKGDMGQISHARNLYEIGLASLDDGPGSRPDQYETTNLPHAIIAGRYATEAKVGLSRIIRMLRLSSISENSDRVQNTDPELSREQRYKARTRALGRSFVAIAINYAPGNIPKPENALRRLAMKTIHR